MTRVALITGDGNMGEVWQQDGPAYANPRPATDLRMTNYDTGQSDPTSDIQAALDAAAAVAQAVGRARLLMDSRRVYTLTGAPTLGPGYQYGQLHVPGDFTKRQVFLELVGIPGAGCVPMNTGGIGGGGTIIESTYDTTVAWDAAKGLPSVIGGPSWIAAGGGRDNAHTSGINLAMRDITMRQPNDPPLAGVDASGMHGFECDQVVWDTPQWASFPGAGGVWTGQTMPVRNNGIALLVPGINAQENSRIGHIYVSGYRLAAYLNEMSIIEWLNVQACYQVIGLGQAFHPCHIGTIGDCNNAVGAGGYNPSTGNTVIAPDGGSTCSYFICDYWDKQPGDAQMAAAFARQYDVYDPNNACPIYARLIRVDANVGRVNGGHKVYGVGGLAGPWSGRINDITSPRGPRTAPSLPASNVSVRNPCWQDCLVTVTGGTFTDVKINGVSAGTGGTYLVPASGSIAVVYTVAPTWAWQGI